MAHTATYKTWKGMIDRCLNPASADFPNYGGRGISVCERWRSFAGFFADMGERPHETTLDRFPDNDGNYEPGNCRWATVLEQARNKRSNRVIAFAGEQMTAAEWAEKTGLNYHTLVDRLDEGWTVDRALTTPTQRRSDQSGHNARGTR